MGSEEEDFFDALDYQADEFEVALPHTQTKHRSSFVHIFFWIIHLENKQDIGQNFTLSLENDMASIIIWKYWQKIIRKWRW